MVKRAAEIEDRRIVAKRLFDALCAAYSDKYITLIQPRDAPLPSLVRQWRVLNPGRGPSRRGPILIGHLFGAAGVDAYESDFGVL